MNCCILQSETILPLPLLVSTFDFLLKRQLGNQKKKKNQDDCKRNSALSSVAKFGTVSHRAWKILYFQEGHPGRCAWVAPTTLSGTWPVPPAHFGSAETTEVADVLFHML